MDSEALSLSGRSVNRAVRRAEQSFYGLRGSRRMRMGEPRIQEKAWEPSFEEGILEQWREEPDLTRFVPRKGADPSFLVGQPVRAAWTR